jgi:hypothetical protein
MINHVDLKTNKQQKQRIVTRSRGLSANDLTGSRRSTDQIDQQISIISHGETTSRSS